MPNHLLSAAECYLKGLDPEGIVVQDFIRLMVLAGKTAALPSSTHTIFEDLMRSWSVQRWHNIERIYSNSSDSSIACRAQNYLLRLWLEMDSQGPRSRFVLIPRRFFRTHLGFF